MRAHTQNTHTHTHPRVQELVWTFSTKKRGVRVIGTLSHVGMRCCKNVVAEKTKGVSAKLQGCYKSVRVLLKRKVVIKA